MRPGALAVAALLALGCAGAGGRGDPPTPSVSAPEPPFADWRPSEQTPVLRAQELLPLDWLEGPHHRLDERVPINGGYGVFLLETDFGPLVVESVELLAVRIAELPAIALLREESAYETFLDATAASTQRAADALAAVLGDPVGTVAGLPAGVARLLRRTLRTVRQVALDLGDRLREGRPPSGGSEGGARNAEPVTAQAERLLLRYLGYNRARRELAARLGVDPYTTNPLLNAQLDELAWAELGGRVAFRTALGATGAVAEAVSVGQRLDRLVWELPPADLRHRNERRLLEAGLDGPRVRAFLRNRAFHPTLQTALSDRLAALAAVPGSEGLLEVAAAAQDELEARALVRIAGMMLAASGRFGALARIWVTEEGSWVRHRDGGLSLILPFDYVSRTAELEALLTLPEPGAGALRVLVAGQVSAGARELLRRMGFRTHPGFAPPAAHPALVPGGVPASAAKDDSDGGEE